MHTTTEAAFIELRELSQALKGRGISAILMVEEEIAKLREELKSWRREANDARDAYRIEFDRAEAAEAKLKAASEQEPVGFVQRYSTLGEEPNAHATLTVDLPEGTTLYAHPPVAAAKRKGEE